MNVILLRPLLMVTAAAAILPSAAVAQIGPTADEVNASNEREINSELLRSALRRIAVRPTDADALVDAGNAALALQDANAALNFFTRANEIQPNNGRIKLGLASASVRTENPFEALRYFDEAAKLGISDRTVAADRAVAFDLLGNFERAQQDYALARTADNSDGLAIKQAVSLSLWGKAKEADALLVPYLQKNSGEAWRARAFMLAARGDTRESVRVTQGFMDAASASQFEPYLRKMPELTGAQQAAAIYFGHFPARNLGRDSAEIRQASSRYGADNPAPKGNSRLIPQGAPLGPKPVASGSNAAPANIGSGAAPQIQSAVSGNSRPAAITQAAGGSFKNDVARTRILAAEQAANSLSLIKAPPAYSSNGTAAAGESNVAVGSGNGRLILPQMPVVQNSVSAPAARSSDLAASVPAPAAAVPASPPPSQSPPPSTSLSQTAATAAPAVLPQASESAPVIAASTLPQSASAALPPVANGRVPSAVNFEPKAAQVAANPVPAASVPADTAPIEAEAPKSFDLGAIVESIEVPASEKKPSVTPVDLSKIKAVTSPPPATKTAEAAKPKEAAKETGAVYPARNWVQIATGEVAAFKGDMRRHAGKNPDLFKGMTGWSSPWKNLNRLVIGPFDDLKAARKWEADFRAAGGDAFVWQSADGTVVEKLK